MVACRPNASAGNNALAIDWYETIVNWSDRLINLDVPDYFGLSACVVNRRTMEAALTSPAAPAAGEA
jgi:hypothetical protein